MRLVIFLHSYASHCLERLAWQQILPHLFAVGHCELEQLPDHPKAVEAIRKLRTNLCPMLRVVARNFEKCH